MVNDAATQKTDIYDSHLSLFIKYTRHTKTVFASGA